MTLSLLIIIPVIGAILVALVPRSNQDGMKWLALVVAAVNLVISLPLYFNFSENTIHPFAECQPGLFEECYYWINTLNINYHVAVDGLSLFMVILTTF
ncbi:MAG: hypothetical protein AAF629_34770 [Chloroflexota bacterium]